MASVEVQGWWVQHGLTVAAAADTGQVDTLTQAKYLARQWLVNEAERVSSIWYRTYDHPPPVLYVGPAAEPSLTHLMLIEHIMARIVCVQLLMYSTMSVCSC